jgi:hypothetical protein
MDFDFYRHRLPDFQAQGALYFVTWRLKPWLPDLSDEERGFVASSLCHFDSQRYALHAYVVMNDHAHVIVEPYLDFRLEPFSILGSPSLPKTLARFVGRPAQSGKTNTFIV